MRRDIGQKEVSQIFCGDARICLDENWNGAKGEGPFLWEFLLVTRL